MAHFKSQQKSQNHNLFSSIAADWWKKGGKFDTLHQFNKVRVPYILSNTNAYLPLEQDPASIKVLDVGCGGGLITEELAKIGLNVTGLDNNEAAIKAAIDHSKLSGLPIKYLHTELLSLEGKPTFDVILLMEVLEHVEDLPSFLKRAAELLKPGGLLFFSTINRNIKAFLLAKVAAEYILKWVPAGIHQFSKFIKPSELVSALANLNLSTQEVCGINYKVTSSSWVLSGKPEVNYIGYATKQ